MDIVDKVPIMLDEATDSPTLARWIEVSTIELAEGPTWIQAFPFVEYEHPLHGKIQMDAARAERMAANVKANVRGQDLDVDYDHKALRGDAAGWIRDAEARSDGLYIFVEWTKEALAKLKEKTYRYFSPEYTDQWKHPDGRVFNDVLWGGALTNRPFLKGITPINLSELVGDESKQVASAPEGGNQVDRKKLEQLATNLKVEFKDDTSDDDLYELVSAASAKEPEPDPKEEEQEENKEPVLASEFVKQLQEEAKTNPAIALMLQEREATEKRIATLEVSNRLSEVTVKLGEIDTKTHALTPKAKQAVRELAVSLSEKGSDALLELVKNIVKDGIVELGERGGRDKDTSTGLDEAGSEFDLQVKKLMEGDDKLSVGEAVELAARDNPELFADYREQSYANEKRGER